MYNKSFCFKKLLFDSVLWFFSGHNCENDVDECELLHPCVNGICENNNGSYQCYCRPGFSGDHCNLEFDECLSRPCRNSGTCINRINGYECVCQPGFTGTDCDIDIDECASAPCQNNATCDDGIATFTCECLPGFADKLCSTNIDECEVCIFIFLCLIVCCLVNIGFIITYLCTTFFIHYIFMK